MCTSLLTATTLSEPPKFDYGASYEKWSEAKVAEFFIFIAGVFTTVSKFCIPLLEREQPLVYGEWSRLLGWVWSVWNGVESHAVQKLFERVVRRGIDDLSKAIENFEGTTQQLFEEWSSRGQVFGAWTSDVECQLCPQRVKDDLVRRELLYLFVDKVAIPLCRKAEVKPVRSGGWLQSLSIALYPRDKFAQSLLIKDWSERISNPA